MADLPAELTREQWDRRSKRHRRKRLKCECGGSSFVASNVFRCRARREPGEPRFRCGRYCCACVGGSTDNRCSNCWARRRAYLEAKALRRKSA